MNETPYRIEPCLPDPVPSKLADLAVELTAETVRLDGALPNPKTAGRLADLVRVMNCYYSNLIEGNKTTPRDIERALDDDMDQDEERRLLQLEARAHIRVQRLIDQQHQNGNLTTPTSGEFLKWIHGEFYKDAPEAMLTIKGNDRTFRMKPGAFRSTQEHDVSVGRHVPPSSQHVDDFMQRFEQRYDLSKMGLSSQILALAAAHHRFNYIHPFPDGNGRVSRLMSHAMALNAGIGAHGLWSVSRGLARGIEGPTDYKRNMDAADEPRRSDLDGRGNLSLAALVDFTDWFLRVCLDQVQFMGRLFDLRGLEQRLRSYLQERAFRSQAGDVAAHLLRFDVMARGDVGRITGLGERTARDLLTALQKHSIVASDTPKSPVYLSFPRDPDAVEVLFPKLYPAT